MINQVIELHDSVIENIHQTGADFVLKFSHAYLHRSEGKPGVDSGTGWTSEAQIILKNASGDFSSVNFPFDIYDGDLYVDGEKFTNCIPSSFDGGAAIELHFAGNDDQDEWKTFVLKGESCKIALTSEPQFVENFKA